MASRPACRVIEPWVSRSADGDRDDRDRDRGEQLERRRRHEGDAQGAHRGDAVLLAHLADHLDLALGPAVADQGGQAAHDVEEVAGQRGERRPALLGLGLGRAPDQGREEREQGQGQQHDEAADPVDPEQRGEREHRHDGAGDERGEEARGIRLDRGRALGREGDRAVGSGAPLRGGGEPALDEPSAQGHGDLDPDPGRDPLGGPGQHGPHGEQARQPQRRGAQRACPRRPPPRAAASAMARPMVATPWRTPTTARTATGRRAAGAVLSSRGSKGLIGVAVRSVRGRGPRPGCSASRAACGRPSRCTPCRAARSG